MARKRGRLRVAGLGYHKNLGQYRKVVRGRSIYFGSDPDEALARYQLYQEPGPVWKRGYRQYCLEKDGKVTPLGGAMEVARRNDAAIQDREKRYRATTKPDEFVVSTVKEVGDAWVYWLTQNDKNPTTISQVTADFKQLIILKDSRALRFPGPTLPGDPSQPRPQLLKEGRIIRYLRLDTLNILDPSAPLRRYRERRLFRGTQDS
jgi:hypothetical protein